MKILSIANFSVYNNSNTALHRHWALEDIADVDVIDFNFKYTFLNRIINKLFKIGIKIPYFNTSKFNNEIIQQIHQKKFDLVWIDKGIAVKKQTLIEIKKHQPNCIIVGYSPDEMTKKHNQSYDFLKSLPYYDFYITTKSYALNDLKNLGAKNVLFVNNAYEQKFHYLHDLSDEDFLNLGGDVGFIGAWEQERANSILFLAKNGVRIRVWGGGKWLEYKEMFPNLKIEERPLFSEDYSKALGAFKINLCFLRKMNNDLQTTRTMEIPACGGFMLAERTSEHLSLFKETEEADFFSTNEELLEKCNYYLNHEDERKRIIKRALDRCKTSGYSNQETIKRILNTIFND